MPDIPKDWRINMAQLEGDSEISAGLIALDPSFDGIKECDCCGQMKPDVKSIHVSYVGDTSACGKCRGEADLGVIPQVRTRKTLQQESHREAPGGLKPKTNS